MCIVLSSALTCGALVAIPCGRAEAQSAPTRGSEQSVVLVSLDGFRSDYLDRYDAPNLRAMAAHGVRARWMMPVFPSLTFPNHYTIVTGLYPAHHGIVNNTIVDPSDGARFRRDDTLAVRDSRWWLGEPLWVTAEKQGVHTAVFFWVGSEAAIKGVRPTRFKPYDQAYDRGAPATARADTALAWLLGTDSPHLRLILMYFSAVDRAGHELGPDAPGTSAAVLAVDSAIGRLRDGLVRAGLSDRVDVIVVSDHGMAPVSGARTVFLDDYLDPASVRMVTLGEAIGLNTRDGDRARIVASLRRVPHFSVYDRDSLPARWHYGDSPRIPEVVGVMDEGWELTTHQAAAQRRTPSPAGAHGYDPETSPLMRALFVAEGPAFRQGVVVAPFRNIHVYDLICGILHLAPAPNDGGPDSTRALLR